MAFDDAGVQGGGGGGGAGGVWGDIWACTEDFRHADGRRGAVAGGVRGCEGRGEGGDLKTGLYFIAQKSTPGGRGSLRWPKTSTCFPIRARVTFFAVRL